MDYISNGNEAVIIEEIDYFDAGSVISWYGKRIMSAVHKKQTAVSEGKKSIRDRLK